MKSVSATSGTKCHVKVFASLRGNNGKMYQLSKNRVVIGAGMAADIRINDPAVAKVHVEINFLPARSNLFSKYSSNTKVRPYSAALRVNCSAKPYLPVYINHQLITSSFLLKDFDVIALGKRHTFEFRFSEEHSQQRCVESGNLTSVLITPNVAPRPTPLRAPQRNLFADFNGAKTNSSARQVLALGSSSKVSHTDAENINHQTPSRIRLLLHDDANIKQNYSPSVSRYFRQINAKSSHILSRIEQLFPDRMEQKNHSHDDETSDMTQIEKWDEKSLKIGQEVHKKSESDRTEDEAPALPSGRHETEELMQVAAVPSGNCSPVNFQLENQQLPAAEPISVKSAQKLPILESSRSRSEQSATSLQKLLELSNSPNFKSDVAKLNLDSVSRDILHHHSRRTPLQVDSPQSEQSIFSYSESMPSLIAKGTPPTSELSVDQSTETGGCNSPSYQTEQPSEKDHQPSASCDSDRTPVVNNRRIFQRSSPAKCEGQSAFLLQIRKLFQNPTPSAHYEGAHLTQLRYLYQSVLGQFCDESAVANIRKLFQAQTPSGNYDAPFLATMRKLYQNVTPVANYGAIEDDSLRDLFVHQSPVANYQLHVGHIRSLMQYSISPSARANYVQNAQYVRYLFHSDSTAQSPLPESVASIRHLFRPGTPKPDYDQHVDGIDILQKQDAVCPAPDTEHLDDKSVRKSAEESKSATSRESLRCSPSRSFQVKVNSPGCQASVATKSLSLCTLTSPSVSPVTLLTEQQPARRMLRNRKQTVHFDWDAMSPNSPKARKVTLRKRQPKKSNTFAVLDTAKQEGNCDSVPQSKVKVPKAKRATKKTTGAKGKRGKRATRARTSISSLVLKLDEMSEGTPQMSRAVAKLKGGNKNNSQQLTEKQLATLKLVLSDSYNELSI